MYLVEDYVNIMCMYDSSIYIACLQVESLLNIKDLLFSCGCTACIFTISAEVRSVDSGISLSQFSILI